MTIKELFQKDKKEVFNESMTYWNSGKTKEWLDLGIDFIMNKREGYYFWDRDGKKLMDVHINGGVYSLGHRNKEIIEALKEGLEYVDMGNHHFPSPFKAALAKELIKVSPNNMKHVIYGSSGGEIVDLALKSARAATNKKKVICVQNCYHGHTGLSVAAGADRYCKIFHSENPDFIKVPFNDIVAMEKAFRENEGIACVIMETIPATYGFPIPKKGYLKSVKNLCEQYEALYIADEVQTGLMRSGKMWCIQHHDVKPDIIVTSKGLSGGIYPISAAILSEKASYWMTKDGSAHMASYGGSELGCICALKVLEIIQRKETIENIEFLSTYLRKELENIQQENPDTFTGIRQQGVIMGLEFAGEKGAIPVMQHLYKNGVWGIYSQLDPHVLQFKPGILCTKEYCDELIEKMSYSIKEAKDDILLSK
ncbi:aspartate aminotransferase family protein [uncultured Clostridium sp.]|uniref:class-III pyridoxal-phosphate-dependent aminotransferase n=1 Tax=uncultured Clostridium sp. TaxID=59620 RepID=UPI0025D6AB2C|nr:aminotransferase class III-fold pyridoxal phosphate-dependent enzyme [uncultured Clostridium sp.]